MFITSRANGDSDRLLPGIPILDKLTLAAGENQSGPMGRSTLDFWILRELFGEGSVPTWCPVRQLGGKEIEFLLLGPYREGE